ncbi:hypothetical protein GCM10007897_32000 [Sphingobium jiangsuense]|uniref:SPP1 family predicted phage head-tail adaptor n=1 Tax=Sphingobium jiangsuense TaxID=870476 RepID=A0A7W6BR70_9SPHN|nr:phage head closure protein [Sphingobium jiangsuense]MBB3928312.1 SPP1 family predicted phage head-tail adaptor [Sphingobium jiangsuense]GLT01802.1 hypothetical protein GCM10007897_32000 [Sphingobium jiangsuense]
MKAGPRNRRIKFERFTETRDAYNEPVKVWSEHCREWAAVYFGSGSEQREAAQTQGAQAASFEVLSNSKTRAVTVMDRILFDGGVWDIRSIAPIGLNRGVKFNAVRAVP